MSVDGPSAVRSISRLRAEAAEKFLKNLATPGSFASSAEILSVNESGCHRSSAYLNTGRLQASAMHVKASSMERQHA
jgi:hypothetical protein